MIILWTLKNQFLYGQSYKNEFIFPIGHHTDTLSCKIRNRPFLIFSIRLGRIKNQFVGP